MWDPRKSRANKTSEAAPSDPPRTPLKTPSKAETGLMGWLKLKKEEPGKWVGHDKLVRPGVVEQGHQQETGVAELPGYQFKSPTPHAMKEVDIFGVEIVFPPEPQVTMSNLTSVEISWKMLTFARPDTKLEENYFTR